MVLRNAAGIGGAAAKEANSICTSQTARVRSGAGSSRRSRKVTPQRTQADAAGCGGGRIDRGEALAARGGRWNQSDARHTDLDREGARNRGLRPPQLDRVVRKKDQDRDDLATSRFRCGFHKGLAGADLFL